MFSLAVGKPSRPRVASKTNIEEFVPEGEGVDDFLSDDDDEEEEEEEDDRWVWLGYVGVAALARLLYITSKYYHTVALNVQTFANWE